MTNPHDQQLRTALLRLGSDRDARRDELPLPFLFRTPAIVLLWMSLVLAIVGLIALSRVRFPHHTPAGSIIRASTSRLTPAVPLTPR